MNLNTFNDALGAVTSPEGADDFVGAIDDTVDNLVYLTMTKAQYDQAYESYGQLSQINSQDQASLNAQISAMQDFVRDILGNFLASLLKNIWIVYRGRLE